MKNFYTLIAAIVITSAVFAQAPSKMSYQAVVRDAGDELVTSQAVGMQLSIVQGSVSGTVVYVETQTPTSNLNGLVSLEIGSGTVVSGTFNSIDWSSGPYFIKTETDPTGGTMYTITGTSQLMSVPYALHAKTVEIDNVNDADSDSLNELQSLSFSKDKLSLSNGGSVVLPYDSAIWKLNGDSLYYNNGNIGIGTNSPTTNLVILDSTSLRTTIRVKNTKSFGSSVLQLQNNVSSTALSYVSGMYLGMNGTKWSNTHSKNKSVWFLSPEHDGIIMHSNKPGSSIAFEIGNRGYATGSAFEVARITATGLGIGTSNPTHPLEVVSSAGSAAHGLKLKRNGNRVSWGVPMSFHLLNSSNVDKQYASISGSIKDNTAGAEAGFISLSVADGSGVWGTNYQQERLRIETERVTVKNVMRLEPRSTSPTSPLAGDIYFSSTTNKLMVYDGTVWRACW